MVDLDVDVRPTAARVMFSRRISALWTRPTWPHLAQSLRSSETSPTVSSLVFHAWPCRTQYMRSANRRASPLSASAQITLAPNT